MREIVGDTAFLDVYNNNINSATEALNEGRIADSTQLYDIFLSHSSLDNELVAG